MRVEDRIGADLAAQGAAAAETQKARPSSDLAAAATSGAPGDDRLQLSSLTGRIRTAFETTAQTQSQRVERLAGQIRGGRYQVDAVGLSRQMAAEAFGG